MAVGLRRSKVLPLYYLCVMISIYKHGIRENKLIITKQNGVAIVMAEEKKKDRSEYMRQYYQKRKEELLEKHKQWGKENKERKTELKRKERARKKLAVNPEDTLEALDVSTAETTINRENEMTYNESTKKVIRKDLQSVDRIGLTMKPGRKAAIKKAADREGISINAYCIKAIESALQKDLREAIDDDQ